MPLPDERPRQSVANLIGRFETQVKRQPSTSPASSRSLSAASHTTSDSTRAEAKERLEWPPKSVTPDERPPPIVPSSSWSRSQATAITEPGLQPQAETVEALTPRPSSTTSIGDIVRPAPPPQKQLSIGITAPTPTTADTPTTAKPPMKAPVKVTASKPPPSANPRTPAKPTGRPSTGHGPSSTQPIKAQHTGPSGASSVRKVVSKTTPATPATPASAKTPARVTPAAAAQPKTPSSTRPKTPSKTPSTGLFAPTAASLARARNAPPPPTTPTKKVTLSSTAAERLSKPTAASMSRARTPTATPARGGPPAARGTATRGTAKPRVSSATATKAKQGKPSAPTVEKVATATGAAVAEVAAVAAVVTAAATSSEPEPEPEPEHVTEDPDSVLPPETNGHEPDTVEHITSDDEQHSVVADEPEDGVDQLPEEVSAEDTVDAELYPAAEATETKEENVETTDIPPDAPEPEPHIASSNDSQEDGAPGIVDAVEVKPALQVGNDIEDMVNMLESVSLKTGTESASNIPDEAVSEIPDEE